MHGKLFPSVPILFMIFASLVTVAPVDVPINMTVSNLPPRMEGMELSTEMLDPLTSLVVILNISDKNTLYDIETIEVILRNQQGSITTIFSWNTTGFHGPEDRANLIIEELCHEPLDMVKSIGTWHFAIRIPPYQSMGAVIVEGRVYDEEGRDNTSDLVHVTGFVSLSTSPNKFSDLQEFEILTLEYIANTQVDITARSTPIGLSKSNQTLDPGAISLGPIGDESRSLEAVFTPPILSAPPAKTGQVDLEVELEDLTWEEIGSGSLIVAIQ